MVKLRLGVILYTLQYYIVFRCIVLYIIVYKKYCIGTGKMMYHKWWAYQHKNIARQNIEFKYWHSITACIQFFICTVLMLEYSADNGQIFAIILYYLNYFYMNHPILRCPQSTVTDSRRTDNSNILSQINGLERREASAPPQAHPYVLYKKFGSHCVF